MSVPNFPSNMPEDVRRQMTRFVRFKMRDGSVHRVRAYYLPQFFSEAMTHEKGKPLSKGGWVMLNAVADDGTAGRMLELIHLARSPLPTVGKEQNFEELLNQLHEQPPVKE